MTMFSLLFQLNNREQNIQNAKLGSNRHKVINRTPTPLQQILQDNSANQGKIVPEPGWIPVTKLSLPKVPLGAAGRPIPQTLQQAQHQRPPSELVQQVLLRNKLKQQRRLEALLKNSKLPSIKFPPISQITGPTPLEPSSTISAAFKRNHASFNSNHHGNKIHQQQQSPTAGSNRPVVIVTTIRPNVLKQQSIPITSSSSPSPLVQIVESRSIRPQTAYSHENSIFPLHLNSRTPHSSENTIPITVFPNDTVLIQYQTTLEKLNTDSNVNSKKKLSDGFRRERATFNIGFEDRINLLNCGLEAEELIREILESPLRKRNTLLGILRMKKKEREREGRKQQEEAVKNQGNQNNNILRLQQQNPPPPPVQPNLNSFNNQQFQANGGVKQQPQPQTFVSNNGNQNGFKGQGQFNTQVSGKTRTIQNTDNRSNFQQTSNGRNNKNKQAKRFGGNNQNNQQIKQTTASSFKIIKTTTTRRSTTRQPPTTTVRITTRKPKQIEITNPPRRLPTQGSQQRAVSSKDTVPAKITVNEQFQHFPGFQKISAQKKEQNSQEIQDDQTLLGSFSPTTLQKSNFEQAFLTKIPAKQAQKQQQQNNSKGRQAQLERARKRLQKQQRQQQKLKKQNKVVGINGQAIDTPQQQKVAKNSVSNTVEPPKFFIDVPKKPLKGVILQQIQNQQQSPKRKQTKRPVFLPGEFTEVQPETVRSASKTKAGSQGRKKQNRNGGKNRNKTPRQNFSSDSQSFGGNSANGNRQPKKVNAGNNLQSAGGKKSKQIFTTSRPQVTQTFVPRQILPGDNEGNSQEQGSKEVSGNTFTIEQFLQRYPEVKRLSSRFGDGKNGQNRVVGGNGNQQIVKNKQNGRKGTKRKQGRKTKTNKKNNRNNNNRNKGNQQNSQENGGREQKSINRRPSAAKNRNKNLRATTKKPIAVTTVTTRRPVVITTTTRRPILTTTFTPVTSPPVNVPRQQKQQRPRPNQNPKQQQQQPQQQQQQKGGKNNINNIENSVPDVDFPEGELSSADYSYLYYQDYYEELVPVHHRFNQLAQSTTTTTPKPRQRNQRKKKNKNKNNRNKKKKGGRQGKRNQSQSGGGGKNKNKQPQSNSFSFFSGQPADGNGKNNKGVKQGNFPNFPSSNAGGNNQNSIQQVTKVVTTRRPKVTKAPTAKRPVLKPSKVGEPKQKPVAIKSNDPSQSGPYGYVDKGTFFTDSHVKGFPDMIEVVYQGFVWALNVYYPGETKFKKQIEKHGGVHTILKDKVKRQKVFFKDGDYIVRVSGRASPYNINRLTFYTAKGEKYGPWGDRRSEDSIDFDVTAPPGHGLAHFSGTVDFGVPFRSISFHWRPHE